MKLKFRYLDPFNDVIVYSANFKNLAEFFRNYQMAVDGGNDPELQIIFHTSELGTETWIRCSHEEVRA